MLTRQFAFFSSMLGLVLLNSLVGSSATLVTTPVFVGLIWIISGTKYAVYAFGFWILISTPSLIQFCFFYVDFLPGFFHILSHYSAISEANYRLVLLVNYPEVWYILFVVSLFWDCWMTKKIGKQLLKQLNVLPYYRH